MITEKDIQRINELYHKSKNEGLTEAEKDEQQALRKAYVEAMRSHVRNHLDNVIIQRPDGSREKLSRSPKAGSEKITDGRKIAVIYPGMGYHKDKPLLYHPTRLVRELGYEVVDISYHDLPQKIRGDMKLMREAAEKAYAQAEEQLAEMKLTGNDDIIFIGKSIGTVVAAKYAKEHELSVRHIWYTPVEATFTFGSENVVAFIGEADPWSNLEVVKEKAVEMGIPLHTYPNCNHSIESSDTIIDVRALLDVIQKTAQFLAKDKN